MTQIADEIAVAISGEYQDLTSALGAAAAEVEEFAGTVATSMGAAVAAMTEVDTSANKLEGTLAGLGPAITVAFAVHEILDLAKNTGEAAAQLTNLSGITGITTDQLSRMKFAASEVSVGWDSVSTGLERLSRTMLTAQEGGKAQQASLAAVGISTADLANQNFTLQDAFERISDSFSHMSDGEEKAALAMQLFSRGGDAMIPLLNKGSDGLQELYEKSDKLGTTWAGQDVAAATALNEKLKDVEAQGGVVARTFGSVLLPIVVDLGQAFLDLGKSAGEFMGQLTGASGNYDDQISHLQEMVKETQFEMQKFTDSGGDKSGHIWQDLTEQLRAYQSELILVQSEQERTTGKYDAAKPPALEKTQVQTAVPVQDDSLKKGSEELDAQTKRINEAMAANDKILANEQASMNTLDQIATDGELAQVQAKEDGLKQQLAAGEISKGQELAGLRELENERFQLEMQGLQTRMGLYAQDSSQYNSMLLQKEAMAKQHAAALAKIDQDAAAASKQAWNNVLQPIGAATAQSIDGLVRGTETGKQAVSNLALSMVSDLIQAGERKVVAWAAGEMAQTDATATGETTRVGTTKAAAITTKEITTESAMSSIASYAAVGGAAAAASVAAIPFYGWAMSAETGAATYGEIMGYEGLASAAGGWEDVPGEVMTLLHPHEMVLPQHVADDVRSGSKGGGRAPDVHIHAMDGDSFRDLLQRHRSILSDAMVDSMRRN